MRNSNDNKATWVALASFVFAVPASLRETLDLQSRFGELAELNWYVAGPMYSVAAIACSLVIWRRLVSPYLERCRAAELAHLNQATATIEAPHYTKHMMRDPLLLDMSAATLARRARLPKRSAAAILAYPDIIPSSDYWGVLEDALLLPRGSFRHGKAKDGSDYGDVLTRARIRWYVDRKIVTVVPRPGNFDALRRHERANWLALFEKQRVMAIEMRLEEN